MPEPFAQRPQPGADEENSQRDHQTGGRSHQTVNANPLTISLAGTAEDGERGHVSCEQREEEYHLAYRSVREEKVLGVGLSPAKSDAPDECNDCEVNGDDDDGNHVEIRNPKSEIRRKSEDRMTKSPCINDPREVPRPLWSAVERPPDVSARRI